MKIVYELLKLISAVCFAFLGYKMAEEGAGKKREEAHAKASAVDRRVDNLSDDDAINELRSRYRRK